MKLKNIIKKEADIISDGHKIQNEMIRGADISVVGHFGNAVSLNVWTGCCCLFHDHNNTENLGIIIKAIVELLDLTEEDGFSFSDIKDIPIRIFSDGLGTRVLGFGHFMKDRFAYIDDMVGLTE